MSYRPKRVFVKTENGAYTEITFQKFKTRRKTDTAFAERKFATVYTDTLVEFDKEGHRKMESDRRHLRHLRQMDKTHKLTYCGSICEADREDMDLCWRRKRMNSYKSCEDAFHNWSLSTE